MSQIRTYTKYYLLCQWFIVEDFAWIQSEGEFGGIGDFWGEGDGDFVGIFLQLAYSKEIFEC